MFGKLFAVLATVAFVTAGCGGSNTPTANPAANNPAAGITTAIGYFKDSNVAGVSYVSGNQSGVTGEDGSFTYEVGKTVTFSVGGLIIGTSIGKSIVTPVDLVPEGSSDSVHVQNIVRFLIMLDSDSDPSNGITISPNVQAAAKAWLQLNFNSLTFDSDISLIIVSVNQADKRPDKPTKLPDPDKAKGHLEATLRCSYAGAYKGTYSGDDKGEFGVLVDAVTGKVTGIAYNAPNDLYFNITGIVPISYDKNVSFISGVTSTGAKYEGKFTSIDNVSGTWESTSGKGNFSGARIGGELKAVYRITGQYGSGLFALDVDKSGVVTGIGYNIRDGHLFELNGTLTGAKITASAATGETIEGIFNITNGELSGSWSDSSLQGSFSGSGCKLN